MNPADDALNGPYDETAPEEVFFMKFLVDRADSIDAVVVGLEEAAKYLRAKESEGYVLAEPVHGGRVCLAPGEG